MFHHLLALLAELLQHQTLRHVSEGTSYCNSTVTIALRIKIVAINMYHIGRAEELRHMSRTSTGLTPT